MKSAPRIASTDRPKSASPVSQNRHPRPAKPTKILVRRRVSLPVPAVAIASLLAALPACATAGHDEHAKHQPSHPHSRENELVGRAVLPAATFAPGFTSGRQLGTAPVNGQPVPFINKQPVQGFSAVLDIGRGEFLAMADNGFGSMENSADFYLRVYRIRPHFETPRGGSGKIDVLGFIELRDPDKKIPFTITEQLTTDRYLTGADFDIESMQRAPDGTLWFGDEFGPFLIHTDATGKVLEAPSPFPTTTTPAKKSARHKTLSTRKPAPCA